MIVLMFAIPGMRRP